MALPISGKWAKVEGPTIHSLCTHDALRTLIAGHSHTMAVAGALIYDATAAQLGVAHGIGVYTAHRQPENEFWPSVYREAAGKTLVISFQGNWHLSDFLFAIDQRFDFNLPPYPLVEDRIIPIDLVQEHLRKRANELPAVLDQAKRSSRRVILAGTPPPRGTPDEIKAMLGAESSLRDTVKASGFTTDTIPITHLTVQIKLWAVMQQVYADMAAASGTDFLPFPTEAMAEDGSLRHKFWAKDVTHANIECGALWLTHLARRL